MGLINPVLDALVEAETPEATLEAMEGLECLTEGVQGDSVVLSGEVVALLTEALDRNGLERVWRQLRKTYGAKWVDGGRTRKQLVSMTRGQRFINHHAHLDALLKGGVRDDGESFGGGGGIRWGGLMEKNGEVLMRTMGSFEYGPSQNVYQQTISFQNFRNIINQDGLTWLDKARLLMRDKVKVHCDCKAYRFYYAYTADQKGFGLYPELRPAQIRNPKNKGGICKHLHLTLQWLGTHNAALARELKQFDQRKTKRSRR